LILEQTAQQCPSFLPIKSKRNVKEGRRLSSHEKERGRRGLKETSKGCVSTEVYVRWGIGRRALPSSGRLWS